MTKPFIVTSATEFMGNKGVDVWFGPARAAYSRMTVWLDSRGDVTIVGGAAFPNSPTPEQLDKISAFASLVAAIARSLHKPSDLDRWVTHVIKDNGELMPVSAVTA